jgi:hypothetical protein
MGARMRRSALSLAEPGREARSAVAPGVRLAGVVRVVAVVLGAPVVLAQLPCSITEGGFSIVPNVLPDPLPILLGILIQ